jgi:hypothetical protein
VMILDDQQRLMGVWSLEFAGAEIRGISSVVNPDKLAHLRLIGDFASLVGGYRPHPKAPIESHLDTHDPGETP